MLSSAVSSVGSRAAMPSWMSTGGGASTGTAARGGGSNGERVPRTGWRFVRHLNRLSALAFLRPVRKVSLGAEFPTPFRESILRPGLPTPLPRAGRAEKYQRAERPLRIPIRGARKERDFRSSASAGSACWAQVTASLPRIEYLGSTRSSPSNETSLPRAGTDRALRLPHRETSKRRPMGRLPEVVLSRFRQIATEECTPSSSG
jgi:hypothetical protein